MSTVFYATMQAQEKTDLLLMSEILTLLEDRYAINFTYVDEHIYGLVAKYPSKIATLNDVLKGLENQVPLQFIRLENSIIIQQKKTTVFERQMLEEVLIKQYLAKGINLNTDGSINIKSNDFEIIPGLAEPDILESIKSLPGITSADESVTNLNIRGGTNDQNLFLWEGIKMWQTGHFFGMISAFDPYSITSTSVIKNGTSARYGDGLSGTVSMTLDTQPKPQLEGNLGLNLISASGMAKIPLSQKISLQLSARRSITDLVETVTYKQYFDRVFQDTDLVANPNLHSKTITTNEAFYFYDVSGKINYSLSKKDNVSLSFITIANNLNYLEQTESTTNNETLESGLSQTNHAFNVKYQRSWNKNFNTQFLGYISNYTLDGVNFDETNNQRLNQFNKVLDFSLLFDNNYTFKNKQQLTFGYHFNEVGVTNAVTVNNPSLFQFNRAVLQTHAGYVQYKKVTASKSSLEAGIRATYFPEFNRTEIEPRININYAASKHIRIYLLGEQKNQATSQIIVGQNDFLGIVKKRWVLANNESVPLLKSTQFSGGLTYNQNQWIINIEGYFKEVTGINSRSQGFLNQFQFTNTNGNFIVKGLDLLLQKNYKSFQSWLGYTLSENTYTFGGLNQGNSFPNNVDIRHNITFNNSITHQNLSVAIGLNWHSGIPTTTANQTHPTFVYNTANSERLNNFIRTDFSLNYSFKFGVEKKARLGLSIWNVLNQKQTILSYYTTANNENVLVKKQSLGLTPNLSFRVFL